MDVKHLRSATKHRISRAQSAYVVHNAEVTVVLPTGDHTDERTLHLGADSQGVLLEVITVPTPDGVLVIHAMLMRKRYRKMLD